MSAFGTKKAGGDEAVQLTFPTIYEYTYAGLKAPLRYGPSPVAPVEALPAGDDLQAIYHEQKRIDANRMAMAKVEATANARARMVASHANYYGMPQPLLTQRKFANPSNGAAGVGGDLYSTRQESAQLDSLASRIMRGGVLRTKEGQRFGFKMLQDRVGQYNAIDEAKQAFLTTDVMAQEPVPTAVSQGLPEVAGVNVLVEFNTLRQTLLDTIINGDYSKLDLGTMSRLLALLFRISPTANREELEDIKEGFESMKQLILGTESQIEEGGVVPDAPRNIAALTEYVDKAFKYVDGMLGGVEKSPKERIALSRNLVKTLGFTKLFKTFSAIRGRIGAEDDVAGGPDDGAPRGRPRGGPPDGGDDDGFDRPARPREDDEQEEAQRRSGVPRMDRDQRQVFARRSGAYLEEGYEADVPQPTNAFRRPEDNRMPLTEAPQEAITFSDVGPASAPPTPPRASAASASPRRRIRIVRGPASEEKEGEEEGLAVGDFFRRQEAQRGVPLSRPAPAASAAASASTAPQRFESLADHIRHLYREGMRDDAQIARVANASSGWVYKVLGPYGKRAEKWGRGKAVGSGINQSPARATALLRQSAQEQLDAISRAATTARSLRAVPQLKPKPELMTPAEVAHKKLGRGGKKKAVKWIQEAVKGMKKGAFTKQALRADETPKEFAKEVLANPSKFSKTTKKRAQFVKNVGGLTKASLPTTREGYVALAEKMRGEGHKIRVNSGSSLKSIRANFIKKFGLK